jgi:hypothetical protein
VGGERVRMRGESVDGSGSEKSAVGLSESRLKKKIHQRMPAPPTCANKGHVLRATMCGSVPACRSFCVDQFVSRCRCPQVKYAEGLSKVVLK